MKIKQINNSPKLTAFEGSTQLEKIRASAASNLNTHLDLLPIELPSLAPNVSSQWEA